MRHRPTKLQSLSGALDGRRHADAAKSEDASLGSRHGVSAGSGAVMLRDKRERLRDQVVCGWLGRHQGVGPADGGAGHDPRTAGQRRGASSNRAREPRGQIGPAVAMTSNRSLYKKA